MDPYVVGEADVGGVAVLNGVSPGAVAGDVERSSSQRPDTRDQLLELGSRHRLAPLTKCTVQDDAAISDGHVIEHHSRR